jgi:hypothetical protein
MDNDYVLNLDEIFRTIESAEVVRIRFLLLDKRLLSTTATTSSKGRSYGSSAAPVPPRRAFVT